MFVGSNLPNVLPTAFELTLDTAELTPTFAAAPAPTPKILPNPGSITPASVDGALPIPSR